MSEPTAGQTNRRRGSRKRLRGALRITFRKGHFGLGPNLAKILWDISQTGACIITIQQLAKGDEVELIIESSSFHQPVKVSGIVVWSEQLDQAQYSTGIAFQAGLPYPVIMQLT